MEWAGAQPPVLRVFLAAGLALAIVVLAVFLFVGNVLGQLVLAFIPRERKP